MTSIAIVDDHRVVARSLKAYLESFPDLTVVGIAASGEELLEHLDEWKPDVVLQDLLLPGGIHGIETTKRILARAPSTRVIALTASIDEARLMGALRAGALGYVRKDAEPETLSDIIVAPKDWVVEQLPRTPQGEIRSEILELVAMNQLDLIAPLIKTDAERDVVGRIVSDRRNLRDRFSF